MTPEDVRKLREFFDSPAGCSVLDQINAGYEAKPTAPECFWRDSSGNPLPFPDDTEVSSADPINPLRPFPAPVQAPEAHSMSWRPVIMMALVASVACAGFLGWFVSAALEGRP